MTDNSFVDYESIGMYIPNLDPRDEETLFQQSRLSTYNKSEGKLRDFSENSNLTAILRGLVFSGSEIQFRNQQILPATALKALSTRVQRKLGVKTVIQLRFVLTTSFSYSFQIDANTEVTDSTGTIRFYTLTPLNIAPGLKEGFVNAVAEFTGSAYNVDTFKINNLTKPLAFVGEVTNPSGIVTLGEDEESIEDALKRSAMEFRTQVLTSLPTYEDAVKLVIGFNAKVKAIYGLNKAKTGINIGTVHVFALGEDGNPISDNQALDIYNKLVGRLQAGTQLLVSPMELLICESTLVARIKKDQDPDTVSENLWQALLSYFKKLQAGQTIIFSNITYELIDTGGLDYIEDFRINQFVNKIGMPNEWVIGFPWNLKITLTDSDANIFQFTKGELEPFDYDPSP